MTSVNGCFTPYVIGIGGTARPNSTSECALIEALKAAERLGARTRLFDGRFISSLPLYVPGRHAQSPEELDYIDSVRACHGIIVSTPGYHGSLSGPVKNVLDLLEDTAKDANPYLEGRSFGCVVTAYGWQACVTTLVSLRMVAHALRAWPTPFGASINTSTPLFDAGGTCTDAKVSGHLKLVASQVVEFARWRNSSAGSNPPTPPRT
jgi:FMN reductase